MGNKDDKKNIADDDMRTSLDISKDTPQQEDDYIVTVKNDSHKPKDAVDTKPANFSLNAEDLSKELDRVESIDTGSLTSKSHRLTDETESDQSDTMSKAPAEPQQIEAEMTRPLDLEASHADVKNKDPKEIGMATVDSALNSHHSFQKQHQKRRILQVFLLLFVLVAIGASVAAGYLYFQLAEVNNKVTQVESELTQVRAQREELQSQLNEQSSEPAAEPDITKVVIDELGVQYTAGDDSLDLVYGYGGTTKEGVTYVHYTSRALADHQETVAGKQAFPCGIGAGAPVTIVRGTQTQLSTLATTQPLTEQRQIGEFFYAISKPVQPCSASQAESIQAVQAAVEAVYATFEPVEAVAEDSDSEAEATTSAPVGATRAP